MPYRSNASLPVSTMLWNASESIADEPDNNAAASLVIATSRLPSSAAQTVLCEAERAIRPSAVTVTCVAALEGPACVVDLHA